MKLIEEIIEILSDQNPNLENALIKTKILLHKLGEKSLISWVNNELNGYQNVNEIPGFRIISTRVLVTATDGYTTRWNDYQAPLTHLAKDIRESLSQQKFGQSISALEDLIKSESNTLANPLPTEFCHLLSKGLGPGVHAESAYKEIAKNQLIQIHTQIRSRLLDFLLDLSERIPDEPTKDDVKIMAKENETENLFNHAIFGDNATIVVGSHNTQNIENNILKNDFDKLAEVLRQNNISEQNIEELNDAIKQDVELVNHDKKLYGEHVNSWLKDMMSKAIDTSWKVELGVASGLLSTALNSYYGWF